MNSQLFLRFAFFLLSYAEAFLLILVKKKEHLPRRERKRLKMTSYVYMWQTIFNDARV